MHFNAIGNLTLKHIYHLETFAIDVHIHTLPIPRPRDSVAEERAVFIAWTSLDYVAHVIMV